jgi:hypothetical protein
MYEPVHICVSLTENICTIHSLTGNILRNKINLRALLVTSTNHFSMGLFAAYWLLCCDTLLNKQSKIAEK